MIARLRDLVFASNATTTTLKSKVAKSRSRSRGIAITSRRRHGRSIDSLFCVIALVVDPPEDVLEELDISPLWYPPSHRIMTRHRHMPRNDDTNGRAALVESGNPGVVTRVKALPSKYTRGQASHDCYRVACLAADPDWEANAEALAKGITGLASFCWIASAMGEF